jgi:hypothetical protein
MDGLTKLRCLRFLLLLSFTGVRVIGIGFGALIHHASGIVALDQMTVWQVVLGGVRLHPTANQRLPTAGTHHDSLNSH